MAMLTVSGAGLKVFSNQVRYPHHLFEDSLINLFSLKIGMASKLPKCLYN